MKSRRISRIRLACQQIEGLEPRCLLSATVVSQIPTQNVTAGQTFTPVSLATYFNDPVVTGTAVELQTPLGNIPLVLTDSQTPQTVANFTHYITSGEYANTIIHRSVPGFIIQGGGYTTTGSHIPIFGTIPGEHHESNTTGTIAMALTGTPSSPAPDSGTSEWFINLANNTGLDDASDGGPFTAFGNVVYNGMNAVNAIANLPIVNDSTQSGAWSTVPVQSGTNGATVSSEPASNLVTINPEIIPGGLTYSAVSSNPGLVTANIDASTGALTLNPVSGGGTATITVTATDMGGGTAKSTFTTNVVNNSGVVTIGAGGAKSCTYTDASGAVATVTLTGGGSATLNFSGTGITQTTTRKGVTIGGSGVGLATLTTTGTSSKSVLTIASRGAVSLGSVTTDSLRSFLATSANLTGTLTSTATIGTLSLASATAATISATSIGTFTVKGNVSGAITAGSLGTVQIGGGATNAVFHLTGSGLDVRTLKVKGAFASSSVNATGNIGTFSAASLTSSSLYAGVGTLSNQQVLPGVASDFSATASIGSVQLRTIAGSDSFTNSDIAATTLGTLTLGTLQTSNGGIPEGVVGESLKLLTATANKRFTLRNASSTNIAPELTKADVALGDVVIQLLAP